MNHGQSQPFDAMFNSRAGLNLFATLLYGHATCFTVFLRRDFGSQALGRNGVVAFLILFSCACGAHDPLFVMFLGAFVLALILQRIRTYRLYLAGEELHSRYPGYPFLAMKLLFARSEGSAKWAEPMFCLILGSCLCPFSESLGLFVLSGMFSLMFIRGFETQVMGNRMRAMRDAAIEQRNMASIYRGESKLSDF